MNPEEPWWNDKDKVAGFAATVTIICIVALMAGLSVKFLMWLF